MSPNSPLTIVGREEHIPSIDAKVTASTGTIDAHFDHLNAQLQKIVLNTTSNRPSIVNRLSDSSNSQHSDATDEIVLSAGAIPGLASSIGTPVSDGISVSISTCS